jgi:hypothetical protein
MKTKIILIALAFAFLYGCKKESNKSENKDLTSQIMAFPIEPLNADEIKSLIHMREEEKLAHDVYYTLYNKWNETTFNNISSSESTHANAVLTLINKYELQDPASNKTIGVFSDSSLQKLYNELIDIGFSSKIDGFKVGATIEDFDIYDLNNWNLKIDNQDIKFVYDNLNKGSRNHMRTFYTQLIGLGFTYQAQYITKEELDIIINSPKETGGI